MLQISKYSAIISLLVFAAFCLPAQAEDVTIGVVNTPRVVQQSPQGKAMQQKLQKEFSDRKQELLSDQNKLKDMQDKMEKDAAIMSQAERQDMQRKIRRLQRNLKRDQQAYQEDLQYERKQELATIKKVIVEAIQTVARQNGYDLVMDQSVTFASNQVNITDEVIDYLRKNSG